MDPNKRTDGNRRYEITISCGKRRLTQSETGVRGNGRV